MRRTNEVDEKHIANVKKISIVGILLAVFIGVFSTYAVYAPHFNNFEMSEQREVFV
jgi:hypothetical protein